MKKIILMAILAMSVIRCELLNPKEWSEYNKRRSEKRCKMLWRWKRICLLWRQVWE